MANEFQIVTDSGLSVYAMVRNAAGLLWNFTAFETYNPSNYGDYPMSLTEQGNTGFYVGNMGSDVPAGSIYSVQFKSILDTNHDPADPTIGGLHYINFGLEQSDTAAVEFDDINLGGDATFTISPFSVSTDPSSWTVKLYVTRTKGGPAIDSLTLQGPSFELSNADGVFTAVFTADQLNPATEPLLNTGTYYIALWRVDGAFVHCIATGPVRFVRLPGLSATLTEVE